MNQEQDLHLEVLAVEDMVAMQQVTLVEEMELLI